METDITTLTSLAVTENEKRLLEIILKKDEEIASLRAEKEREGQAQTDEPLEFVEVTPDSPEIPCVETGIKLYSNGVEVKIEKNFDGESLVQVLQVLRGLPCSASAVQ